MRTHARPMTLSEAIQWQVNGGHTNLYLLMDIDTHTVIKIGKLDTLQTIKDTTYKRKDQIRILNFKEAQSMSVEPVDTDVAKAILAMIAKPAKQPFIDENRVAEIAQTVAAAAVEKAFRSFAYMINDALKQVNKQHQG